MGVSRSGPQKANVLQWAGDTPGALVSGRVPSVVQVVSDKTGYSLTAGSYSLRASSSQHVLNTIPDLTASQTVAIASVTTTRATVTASNRANDTVLSSVFTTTYVSAAATTTSARQGGVNLDYVQNEVTELL